MHESFHSPNWDINDLKHYYQTYFLITERRII